MGSSCVMLAAHQGTKGLLLGSVSPGLVTGRSCRVMSNPTLWVDKLRRGSTGIAAVTLVVGCFYAGFALVALGIHDWNALWFVWMGERYADLDPDGRTGYDGQFIYYIARDGETAIPHLDNPPYRLQRILLPIAVRLLSLGASASVSWLLVVVNGLAIVVTAYLLAKWLDQRGVSPWYALMYALYIGTFMAFSRDLTEPLALGLAAGGSALWLQGRRVRAVLLLALAVLAKEITLLFAIGITFSEVARGRPRLAIGSLAAGLPLFAKPWRLFLLGYWVFPTLIWLVPVLGWAPWLSAV